MMIKILRTFLFLIFFLFISLLSAHHVIGSGKTIGIIMTGDIPYYQELHNHFMARLQKTGHTNRINVIVQKPYPDPISLSNAARKLIAMDVDVIITYGLPATIAVIDEKTKIPVVYAGVYDPLVSKVKTRNITGISSKVSVSSLLRYLRGFTQISTLGVVFSSNEEDSIFQMRELLRLSEQYKFKISAINLKKHQDITTMLSEKRLDAIFVTGSSIAEMALPYIANYAKSNRIPYATFMLNNSSNAIVTLSPSPKELGEHAAEKTARILDGTPPERIGMESSRDTELIFNMKEALDIGLRIPMELVTEATRLIK